MGKRLAGWLRRRFLPLMAERGVSLVEVLVATAILALILVPMLNFSAYTYNGQAYERQLAATWATDKMEDLQTWGYRKDWSEVPDAGTVWLPSGGDAVIAGKYVFIRTWTRENLSGREDPEPYFRKYTVVVTCQNCRQSISVKVVSYLVQVGPGATSSTVE
jgi:prepilin-type N-terminal cleavage/methylation domain-containing protein